MSEECDHTASLELLMDLEEAEEFDRLLEVAVPLAEGLEQRGSVEDLKAMVKIRGMIMKALALTDREDELLKLFESDYSKYAVHADDEVMYWTHSAAISSADSYWVAGNTKRAVELLQFAYEKFRGNPRPAMRMLALRAAIDLAICIYDGGDPHGAITELEKLMAEFEGDDAENVREEYHRAAEERVRMIRAAGSA